MKELTRKWNDAFETGITEIDIQHKELFAHIDKLSLAIYSDSSIKELTALLKFLEKYIDLHFSTEENKMYEANYPDLLKQSESHAAFTDFFHKVESEISIKGPDKYLAIKIEKEMHNWWTNHILDMDMKYVPYLKGKKK